MFDAARAGDTNLVLSAVDAGLPPNLTNDKGRNYYKSNFWFQWDLNHDIFSSAGNTLLMLAAYAGHTELTKGLLERGADPNRTNDLGQSIVAGAVFKMHNDIVHALMANGADPRAGIPNAIQAAQMFRRTELMEVLGAQEEDLVNIPTPLPGSAQQETMS